MGGEEPATVAEAAGITYKKPGEDGFDFPAVDLLLIEIHPDLLRSDIHLHAARRQELGCYLSRHGSDSLDGIPDMEYVMGH